MLNKKIIKTNLSSCGIQKNNFTQKVLSRYKKKKPVNLFIRNLFENENAESINLRFKKAREAL